MSFPPQEFEDDAPPPDEADTDGDDSDETEPCPHCSKPIHEEAEICHHCGTFIDRVDPTVKPPWISIAVIVALIIGIVFWLV
jgi:predicted nucleic acid-binding Zn ribbon protein